MKLLEVSFSIPLFTPKSSNHISYTHCLRSQKHFFNSKSSQTCKEKSDWRDRWVLRAVANYPEPSPFMSDVELEQTVEGNSRLEICPVRGWLSTRNGIRRGFLSLVIRQSPNIWIPDIYVARHVMYFSLAPPRNDLLCPDLWILGSWFVGTVLTCSFFL